MHGNPEQITVHKVNKTGGAALNIQFLSAAEQWCYNLNIRFHTMTQIVQVQILFDCTYVQHVFTKS